MTKLFKMKYALLIAAAAAFTAFTILPAELPIGATMPKAEVKMKDISGKEVSLKDAKKKNGTLVIFSCNTCPYVVKNESRIREIGGYTLDKNVGVIVINSNEAYREGDDSFEAMKAYAKKQSFKWSYVVDINSELANAFGAKRTPECFLFDADDKLIYHGAIDDNPANIDEVKRKHLKEAIDEMTSGKEITIKTSKSVGCTIKRKS